MGEEILRLGEAISKFAVLCFIVSATVAALQFIFNRRAGRVSDLRKVADDLRARGVLALASEFAAIDPWVFVADDHRRSSALQFLLEIERAAKNSGNLAHWEQILLYNEVHALRQAIKNLVPLACLVRRSDITMTQHVWNGNRAQAFCHALKLFGGRGARHV